MSIKQHCLETPRLLMADAYTIGSGGSFESSEAEEASTYYLTFRRGPSFLADRGDNTPYTFGDDRIVFAGLQRILDRLLRNPVTHLEIDETVRFLKNRKLTTNGVRDFDFPETVWRRVVDEFKGRPPITIFGFPEGSVVYPGEPVFTVSCYVPGMGFLAAWFESKLVHVWAPTERLTAARHWAEYNRSMIRSICPSETELYINMWSLSMMHDFGDRSAMCAQESEDIGYVHLYCFPGSDTFSAAYQAWRNGAPDGAGVSVDALAHRIVQGYVDEVDAYTTIYEQAQSGDIISMVADCYDYYTAVSSYLLPLAQRSANENDNKIVVARPDSGNALEQILYTVRLAVDNGLFVEKDGYKYMTTLRIIEGDSMDFATMQRINKELISEGFAPHGCLLYGVGGFLRNSISRDNFSTKYALCSVGANDRPVIKVSNSPGKETLQKCLVTRDPSCLESGITLHGTNVEYKNAHSLYYDCGIFGEAYNEDFITIQNRVLDDFDTMPLTAGKLSPELTEERRLIAANYGVKI